MKLRARPAAWGFLWAILLCAGCRPSGPPYAPRDALATFRIEPGFRIELFAAEPDVTDPVAMEFDERGRVWVVENSGYPLDTSGKGRVKLLEDTDGDGRPDRSTLFADKLMLPTGILRWKNGVLVTDAPDLLYLEDTNGDGRADLRRVVLTGFAFTNPQHTVNTPLYGLDNRIHLAHENASLAVIFKQFGDPGKDIRFPDRPGMKPLAARGRSIRFHPDSGEMEARSGTSQFGHAFDAWGRYFTMNNSNHLRQEVIAARYLERNPYLAAGGAMQDLSDHGAAAEVYPITVRPRFEMLTNVGQMTSACGLTIYQGGAWGARWEGVSFGAEPVHNLVHRDVLSPAGSTFRASRAYERREFLVSTDSWFRPVNFHIGPDGALYVIDYYRLAIEHPEWMSTHTHHSKDLSIGSDRGRIWRIVPESGKPLPLARGIRLHKARDEELVGLLGHANLWWRRAAQRLLVDRKALAARPAIERLFRESASPAARLHALWTLEGLGALDERLVERALRDPVAGVRENAILLSESLSRGAADFPGRWLEMAEDPDARVRFQLLCTLGSVNSAEARAARDRLLDRDLEDRWVQVAALSASPEEAARVFARATAHGSGWLNSPTEARTLLLRQACAVIGARRRREEIARVLQVVARRAGAAASWWRAASLEGLAAGLRGKHDPAMSHPLLVELFESDQPAIRRAALRLLGATGLPASPKLAATLGRSRTMAADPSVDAEARADAITLVALAGADRHSTLFRTLAHLRQPEPVQAAAVRALGRVQSADVGPFLLANWRAMTAPVRSEAADALTTDLDRAWLLVAAIQRGEVQPWTLSFNQKRRLLMNRDEALREKARSLLEEKPGEREAVLARYQAALDRPADAARGRVVFQNVCAKCHRWNGEGASMAPDLASVRNRPRQALLEDILVPSKAIAQNYETYVVETAGGAIVEGVLGSQDAASITLRQESDRQNVIPRSEIRGMYAAHLSAMPADLEKQVDIAQMADLLEFLTGGRR